MSSIYRADFTPEEKLLWDTAFQAGAEKMRGAFARECDYALDGLNMNLTFGHGGVKLAEFKAVERLRKALRAIPIEEALKDE